MDRFAFRVFPAAEAVLYVSFLILDLSGHMTASIPLKYTGIILCLFAAIPSARTADGCVTSLALAFTAAADWFLLLQNRHYMVGISLFLHSTIALLYPLAHVARPYLYSDIRSAARSPFTAFFTEIKDGSISTILFFRTCLPCIRCRIIFSRKATETEGVCRRTLSFCFL